MKTRNYLKVLAPVLVAIGIFNFFLLSVLIIKRLNCNNLFDLLYFIPVWVIRFVGAMNVISFLPIFILGIYTLGTDGAIGQARELRTWSIYKYLRNPMYAGISFTVFGIGLFFGITAVASTGLLWLLVCFFVSLTEEKSLIRRFGETYVFYKKSTPRFIPDFQCLIKDIFLKNLDRKETKN